MLTDDQATLFANLHFLLSVLIDSLLSVSILLHDLDVVFKLLEKTISDLDRLDR